MTNDAPEPAEPIWEPPYVDPDVTEAVAGAAPGQLLQLHLRLRNFPERDIPPRPNSMIVAAVDLELAAERRQDAFDARQSLAEQMAAEVIAEIENGGGEVTAVRGSSGWLWADVPADVIDELSERTDLDIIRIPNEVYVGAAWYQGEGRWATRMNADTFHASGFDGEISNPDTHGLSRLVASVIEVPAPNETVSGFEDEACAFYNGANCTGSTRIIARYKCDNGGSNPCHFVTGFADSDEENHGTSVSSALLGDYMDDQGCGQALNDPAWTSGCHTAAWEASATGMAPEAYLEYFSAWASGWSGTLAGSVADAIQFSYFTNQADVINASWGSGATCNEDPGTDVADEAENAFDDGSLIVAAAGNANGPSSACNVWNPAGLIKTLAVNAFDAVDPATCQSNYHQWCLVDELSSAAGGITANVAGTNRANALTAIDLVGPNEVLRWTTAGGLGDVTENSAAAGTSYATPTIAGLALLMKHRMLYYGNTWVNSPGRLLTVMLAMGDRHYSTNPTSKMTSTQQLATGGDPLYGFGRVTMRKFIGGVEAPSSWSMVTWNTQAAT